MTFEKCPSCGGNSGGNCVDLHNNKYVFTCNRICRRLWRDSVGKPDFLNGGTT